MKKTILIFFLFFTIVSCQAQWQKRIGINFLPAIAKTFDINGTLKNKEFYAVHFATGYTFNTPYTGVFDYKVYDFYENRHTSGWFLKGNFLFYPASINGKQRKNNFFVGTGIAMSNYRQSAIKIPYKEETIDPYKQVIRATILRPIISIGFTSKLSEHLYLDWGVQRPIYMRTFEHLGTSRRAYLPGIGNSQSDFRFGYLQGILRLHYSF